jgi:S-adenosylmethionine:tRNA ribosyltransferase-isomerase
VRTLDFDYTLPDERVARTPAARGQARLLVLDAAGEARHRSVSDLPALLEPGDLVVVNDTRVVPARLEAVRVPSGGRAELLLLDCDRGTVGRALMRPAKKLAPGETLRVGDSVDVVVESRDDGGVARLRFSAPVADVLARFGAVPLPPYLKRAALPEDRDWYQTVYAAVPGAVAAPTAGLHLTREMLAALDAKGVEDHRLDAERYEVPPAACRAIERARARGGRVMAVGTTVVRCLEAAALAGGGGAPIPGAGSTDLFIRPGFAFQVVDRLLTNFHLPRSTLLMLVCAFAGTERVLAAYREAIERGYRFYSYGDAMVVERRCDTP